MQSKCQDQKSHPLGRKHVKSIPCCREPRGHFRRPPFLSFLFYSLYLPCLGGCDPEGAHYRMVPVLYSAAEQFLQRSLGYWQTYSLMLSTPQLLFLFLMSWVSDSRMEKRIADSIAVVNWTLRSVLCASGSNLICLKLKIIWGAFPSLAYISVRAVSGRHPIQCLLRRSWWILFTSSCIV